ncbi:MAG: hypothetical protein SGJ18_07470 [Pseudomonadota bacterium]|nr:hypothetical protein [Pseudomonadota bacterium]
MKKNVILPEIFPKDFKELTKNHTDWIELFPKALTFGQDSRPLLLLKDKTEDYTLPVWLGSLDAAVATVQENPMVPESSPHKTTLQILRSLNLELTHCLFTEVTGLHQYVELCFKSKVGMEHVRCRADESMSLCLLARARFFSPIGIIRKAQKVDVHLIDVGFQEKQPLDPNNIYLN